MARLCDDATAIGLLGPGRETGEVYRFRHALIRETLYAELTPQSRAQAHHRIAAVLENSTGRSHAELAYHFLRAAPASAEYGSTCELPMLRIVEVLQFCS